MDTKAVGQYIAALRRARGLTQGELGERLGLSPQAVSKWERDEALPDITLLPDIASILATTVDDILSGGTAQLTYKGKITVADMAEGIMSLRNMGERLGRENILYRYAVEGINSAMNTNIEDAFTDDHIFECFVAEAVICRLRGGAYVDITDVKNSFRSEHLRDTVIEYASRYGIK